MLIVNGVGVGDSSDWALVREAEHAETTKDFIHKMAIAQKEINETIYWIKLLKETEYLATNNFKV